MEDTPLKLLENEVVTVAVARAWSNTASASAARSAVPTSTATYWARPVPGFGDPQARVLRLRPRPRSPRQQPHRPSLHRRRLRQIHVPLLHRLGFASQPNAIGPDDGLQLHDLWITAAVRCAPPDNKPLPSELANCAEYTAPRTRRPQQLKVVVALGKFAFDAYLDTLLRQSVISRKTGYPFAHAAEYPMPNGITLLASYHPSNQNTATGKLTAPMFEAVFARARQLAME